MSDDPIEVVAHDQRWAERFAVAERELRVALSPFVLDIEHIGSTAVPGLAAKPVVDLMALVPDLDAPVPVLVEHAGYELPAAYNAELHRRRFLCRPSAAHRTHHLHLTDDPAELARLLTFRDRLRADPDLAAAYAALKRDAASRHRDDREAYTEAKAAFVARAIA